MTGTFEQSLPAYKPSGRCPLGGTFITLLLCLVAALVLAPVYGFVVYHNPSAWLGILAPFGYGFLVNLVLNWGIDRFGIRNPWVMALIASVSMAAGYWLHWYAYGATVYASMENDPWNLRFIFIDMIDWVTKDHGGEGLWSFIQQVNEVGLWSLGRRGGSDSEIRGAVLWLVWLGEFIILFAVPIVSAWKTAAAPWSETLECPMPIRKMDYVIAWQDGDVLRSQLARGDVSALCEVLLEEEEEDKKEECYATVTIYEDPRTPCLSVTNVRRRKKKVKEKTVLQYVYITPEAALQIQEALTQPLQSM